MNMHSVEISGRRSFLEPTYTPVEGFHYSKGTPLDSFILPDTDFTWEDFYLLARDAVRNARTREELTQATMLEHTVATRMGNPWAGDTSRIARHTEARIALLARTKSKHRDVIVAMLQAGYEVDAIASATGLHASTVRKWRRWMKIYRMH